MSTPVWVDLFIEVEPAALRRPVMLLLTLQTWTHLSRWNSVLFMNLRDSELTERRGLERSQEMNPAG